MIARALAGGLAGSAAMDAVQDAFAAAFERGREPDDRDEETEAIVGVVRRIAPYVPFDLARRHAGMTGRALHYAFGGGFALAYAAARSRVPALGVAGGLAFGTALWMLSDVVLIPLTKLGRPWARYSRAERLNALASHLAYAATVDAIIRSGDRGGPSTGSG